MNPHPTFDGKHVFGPKSGLEAVKPDIRRNLSPDEVAMVVGTVVVQGQKCPRKPNDYPLNVAVAKLGQDLVDFEPGSRYAPLVEVKMKKAYEFIAGLGLEHACKGMEETLHTFLPDVYP